MFKDLGEI
jgi:RNA recognition motif-containing protein